MCDGLRPCGRRGVASDPPPPLLRSATPIVDSSPERTSRRWAVPNSTFARADTPGVRSRLALANDSPLPASCASLRETFRSLPLREELSERLRTPHSAEVALWDPSQPLS